MTFAVITPALIIGCYVERINFSAVLIFSSLWLLAVYCPTAFWIWGGGFLAELGVKDFAGGIVVHTTAGVAALVNASGRLLYILVDTPVVPVSFVFNAANICSLFVAISSAFFA